jgi:hypothetical protein
MWCVQQCSIPAVVHHLALPLYYSMQAQSCQKPATSEAVFQRMLGMLRSGAKKAYSDSRAWDEVHQATRQYLPPGCILPPNGDLLRVGQEAIRFCGEPVTAVNPNVK